MKCRSPACQNEAETFGWCNKCLDELGEFIEQNPIGATNIGRYSMAHHFDALDEFVIKMKNKVILRNDRHGHTQVNQEQIKEHFIGEILETFDLSSSEREEIKRILLKSAINKAELIDVANLAWMLDYFM